MSFGFRTDKRAKRRRRVLLALLALSLTFYSLALSQGWLDRVPPRLEATVPKRVPAGEVFKIQVRANEPVQYGEVLGVGERAEAVDKHSLRLAVLAQVGENQVNVTATDRGGNVTPASFVVQGVPETKPSLSVTPDLVSGDPVGVQVRYAANPRIVGVSMTLEGTPLRVFRTREHAFAIGSVPLGSETGTLPLTLTLTDEFGRVTRLERSLAVAADSREVELLELSPEVLSVSTPEGRELEERTLETAYAKGVVKPLWRAPFLLPVEGEGTSSFGDPRQYGVGGNISYHQGADMGAPEGTPVHATNVGIVRVAGTYPIKGGLVVIDHGGGVFSLYFHQSRILVKAGQHVARGELIGEVGSTGLSTGPHLHWEMRVDGEATNPLRWVGRDVP